MKAHIVIGKNFGDEGKGLATYYFAVEAVKKNASCIAVRFNGGAQAGHTVDTVSGRFVFHELSSASFRRVDTYWAKDFLPDLYKLEEELNAFKGLTGFAPKIYAHPYCRIVTIDDVLTNMAAETARGKERHGSCGMGIYEAVVRSEEHPLYLKDVKGMSAEQLYFILKELRENYYPLRFEELGNSFKDEFRKPYKNAEKHKYKSEKQTDNYLSADGVVNSVSEYLELLTNDNVLRNAAEGICRGAEFTELKEHSFISEFDEVIFEGAQGLLLDTDNTEFAPHISASHTGAKAAVDICSEEGIKDIEIAYVTRTYVTRHGAGVLPFEEEWPKYNLKIDDATNIENPWQGKIRYAPHESPERFIQSVTSDINSFEGSLNTDILTENSLFITHLNETDKRILFADDTDGNIDSFMRYPLISGLFNNFYLSETPFSEDLRKISI